MATQRATVLGTVTEPATGRLPVLSWALYDLANTIFLMGMSLYFSRWIVNDMGGTDFHWAVASSVPTAIIFFTAPFLGALSDQVGRRLPFLIVTTLVTVACTAALGTGGLIASLALFVLASTFFQAGMIFYDALLPTVSSAENRGRVGGLGVGLGYMGSFIIVLTGLLVLSRGGDEPLLFRLIALLFLLFSLPCFLWVKERGGRSTRLGLGTIARAAGEMRYTLAKVRRYPGLPRFLIGRVFYTEAANTLSVFLAIYVSREVGFTETQVQIVSLVGITAAVLGALAWGKLVDIIGPKRSLDVVLVLWAWALTLVALIAYLDLPDWLFWPVTAVAGVALGGTWTADRPLMLRLSPPRYLGEFYGLYAMVGRFSAVFGPLLWVLISEWLGLGRPAAIVGLLGMVVVGYIVLRPVSDAPRPWSVDELQPESA